MLREVGSSLATNREDAWTASRSFVGEASSVTAKVFEGQGSRHRVGSASSHGALRGARAPGGRSVAEK
jgi:hypothetical protein